MGQLKRIAMAIAGIGLSLAILSQPGSAASMRSPASALRGQDHSLIEIRSRTGEAVAGAIIGGILGGIIASQARPYYRYPYAPYPYAYPYAPVDPAIAYCIRRYRSYDPYSMTYLGNDGYRHPCP